MNLHRLKRKRIASGVSSADTGAKRPKISSKIPMAIAALLIIAGGYLIFLNLSPGLTGIGKIKSSIDLDLSDDASDKRNRIQIAKINLEVPFYTGANSKILEAGAWHRFPERGNPEIGGNFVLSAHRFELGSTPLRTKEKSPFYNVDKLVLGDEIKVYFNDNWYNYKIIKKYDVKPNQVSIEAPSETAKLTLYTCSLKGSADGRVVIEAIL